ncbi:MAG: hypothetical protein Q8880_04465 [Bacteroidota bacterium]|nr:hypothetical protein [Bacteroidota bacterium]
MKRSIIKSNMGYINTKYDNARSRTYYDTFTQLIASWTEIENDGCLNQLEPDPLSLVPSYKSNGKTSQRQYKKIMSYIIKNSIISNN